MTDDDPNRPDIDAALELIEAIEQRVPDRYRTELLRALLPVRLGPHVPAAGAPPPPRAAATGAAEAPPFAAEAIYPASAAPGFAGGGAAAAASGGPARGRPRLDLEPYAPVLAVPGKMLLKALTALEVASSQLGIDWMTPAEIERFLSDRARVGAVYRTNISNALRAARPYADRRRRGRAYEYRITTRGRAALRRDLLMRG